MNIGIYAGTFDPVHDGHIAFAKAAISKANLDKVVIVAEKEPYRKKPKVH
jgi:nicotinate-nucleotide adenylyltransferase